MKEKKRKAVLARIEEMLKMRGVEVDETVGMLGVPVTFGDSRLVVLDGSRKIVISIPPGSYS